MDKDTSTYEELQAENQALRLELANARAMVRQAVKLIEDLLPGFSKTAVHMGQLNDWLLASRAYNVGEEQET